jgi:hypothetical protein
LNAQWKKRVSQNNYEYAYYVPLVDVSQPMYDNGARSLFRAIGLGCEIAEKSFFGRRVMAFSPKPYWVVLDNCEFDEMVRRIISAIWTPDNYVEGAFASVLEAILFADMTPEEVSKLKVVLITNRPDDVLITNRPDDVSLPAHIVEAWSQAGIHKFGRPFLLNGNNFEKISV